MDLGLEHRAQSRVSHESSPPSSFISTVPVPAMKVHYKWSLLSMDLRLVRYHSTNVFLSHMINSNLTSNLNGSNKRDRSKSRGFEGNEIMWLSTSGLGK